MQTGQSRRITDTLPSWAPWALLLIGVAAAGTSAILIRYSQEAHYLAISFWRCFIGALVLLPFAFKDLRDSDRSSKRNSLIAGTFLALHFATWIASLERTSVAESVLLVSMTPVFIALAAPYVLKEKVPVVAFVGIGLAVAGAVLVGGLDFGGSSMFGNFLALVGGATAGGYVLAGQLARRRLGIFGYAVIAYGLAAAILLAACMAADVQLVGYEASTWWALAGLIVGPQLLGHTVVNFVLSDLDAATVSVAIMAEPIITITLAFLIFHEVPTLLVYPGGAAILAGIYIVSLARKEAVVVLE